MRFLAVMDIRHPLESSGQPFSHSGLPDKARTPWVLTAGQFQDRVLREVLMMRSRSWALKASTREVNTLRMRRRFGEEVDIDIPLALPRFGRSGVSECQSRAKAIQRAKTVQASSPAFRAGRMRYN